MSERRRFAVHGVVQGVGFRPFVYVTATALGLTGSVANDAEGVIIEVEGADAALDELARRLHVDAPPLATVTSVDSESIEVCGGTGFVIGATQGGDRARTLAPPTWPPVRTACVSWSTPVTVATATPSSPAPTAARGSPS